jgi:group II intron reverse transcriptase/maturase
MTSEMLIADNYLAVVNDRGNRKLPLTRVYRNMRKRGLFLKAYGKIYQNAGATTIGTDENDTIQGMSLKRIDDIIEDIRNGTYKWKPSRRVHIPKGNGKTRPLSIPNWNDKLVQEVMRMILEAYFEPQFKNSSHGFRPNRSCHTALECIKTTWAGTKWFIEGDIKGCFDNINHELVTVLLSRHIHDNRFLKLVKGALKAGYFEDWKYQQTFSGTPQGGIISPILSNIVLHELDMYVEEVLIPKYTAGKNRKMDTKYRSIYWQITKARRAGQFDAAKAYYRKLRQCPSVKQFDPDFRRLKYVRYADDFLLGFIGSKEEAQEIKQELKDFLESIHLTLSEEKTRITHARTDCAHFLGYDIRTSWNNTKITKYHDGSAKRRSVNGVIQLYVPKQVVTEWSRRYTQNGKPAHIGHLANLSDYEIVLTYGSQLRGIVNYYFLASNCGKARSTVRWYCMESCRKTLGAKHKIRSTKALYKKYYNRQPADHQWKHFQVVIERENKQPLVARCGETPIVTRKLSYTPKDEIPPPIIVGQRSELVTTLLAGQCQLCGREDNLEAHHIRKLKDLKRRWQGHQNPPRWVESMIARRRKTIVVCKECHNEITFGRYDGEKLK